MDSVLSDKCYNIEPPWLPCLRSLGGGNSQGVGLLNLCPGKDCILKKASHTRIHPGVFHSSHVERGREERYRLENTSPAHLTDEGVHRENSKWENDC